MDKKTITTTIRIPRDIWLRLRRMQEEEIIVSINDAVVKGLNLLIDTRED